jgi:hypothetical protein
MESVEWGAAVVTKKKEEMSWQKWQILRQQTLTDGYSILSSVPISLNVHWEVNRSFDKKSQFQHRIPLLDRFFPN